MGLGEVTRAWLAKVAVRQAMKTPAPDGYAITGPEVDLHDFHHVVQSAPEGDARFIVDSANAEGVAGRWREADAHGGSSFREAKLSWAEISRAPIQIRYTRGGVDAVFMNPLDYLLGGQQRVRARWWWIKFTRGVLHLQGLAREDRMRVLRVVVDRKINEDKTTTAIHVVSAVHGLRWLYHPQKDSQLRHIRLTLESLQHTGELKQQETSYLPTPMALATLHVHETEQKRFATQNRHSWTIACLTAGLVAVGILQVTSPLWLPSWESIQDRQDP